MQLLDWSLVGMGFGIGLAVSAPVGPVNIMVIHRGVRRGFWPAFSAGLGAWLADGLYAAAAAFGLTAVSDAIEGQIGIVKLVGGILLIGFGILLAIRKPDPDAGLENDTRLSKVGAAAAAFALSVINPGFLVAIVALFSSLDELGRDPDDFMSAATLTASVIAGSLAWWLGLAALVSYFRTSIGDGWLRTINIVSGIALAGCGLLLLFDWAGF